MNSTQKAELREIISNDCQIQGQYINFDGQTCALGAMCLAKGIPLPDWSNTLEQQKSIELTRMSAPLQAAFGLGVHDLFHIQRRNDAWSRPGPRRVDIIKYLDSLPITD